MRSWFFFILLFPALLAAGSTRFVQPLGGSQVIGRQVIQAETTALAVDRVEFRVDGVLVGIARKPPFAISHDFGDELRVRVIEASVVSKGFTTRESATIRTAGMSVDDAITVDLVEVPIRIRGNREVKATQLAVSEDGIRQSVRSVERKRAPASFHFIVDRSLSMKGDRLGNTVLAIADTLGRLQREDRASVITFNHIVDPPIEASLFRKSTPSGGTSLRDAVSSVDNSKRSYVIVVTDGADRNSRSSGTETLRKIATSNASIYAITLGSGEGTRFVEQASAATGGLSLRATASSIRDTMKQIVDDIDSRYVLTYQSSSQTKGWRAIRVEAPKMRVDGARKGYYAR